jgi:hypothetical protein
MERETCYCALCYCALCYCALCYCVLLNLWYGYFLKGQLLFLKWSNVGVCASACVCILCVRVCVRACMYVRVCVYICVRVCVLDEIGMLWTKVAVAY